MRFSYLFILAFLGLNGCRNIEDKGRTIAYEQVRSKNIYVQEEIRKSRKELETLDKNISKKRKIEKELDNNLTARRDNLKKIENKTSIFQNWETTLNQRELNLKQREASLNQREVEIVNTKAYNKLCKEPFEIGYKVIYLLDKSSSMDSHSKHIMEKFVEQFSNKKREGEHKIEIISFNENVYIELPFTESFTEVRKAVENISFSGGTNLNTGIIKIVEEFEQYPSLPKTLIIIGDEDGGSSIDDEQIEKLNSLKINVLLIGTRAKSSYKEIENRLDNAVYFLLNSDELIIKTWKNYLN
jgi:uncharacterized protein with von Willebrand factor type A (vWA) domain